MTSTPKQRLQQLNQHLQVQAAALAPAAPVKDPNNSDNPPKIKSVAPDSVGQRVKGKVIIVTGANSPLGIGRATAYLFARNGAQAIYLCDYDDSHLMTYQRELTSLYPVVDIHPRRFDASDEACVKAVVDDALERHGRLDVYFANAGVMGEGKIFTDISSQGMMQTLRVNVLSVFLAAKYAAPAMRRTSTLKPSPSGSIISTASVAGLRSGAGPTDYSASKAAVISLMQTIAWQLTGTNIRCNAICPGIVETGMTAQMYDAARARGTVSRIGQLNPLRRGAVADEIARVALFLASDESSYVNGQGWAVCGGLTAGLPVVPGKLG
ncbi:MAG: hypothetical protein M1816_005412 [Peltula sp. TS41687]|nr:MAG: hypothetical protein M1816_005412 [Peltula sp. TS41687]